MASGRGEGAEWALAARARMGRVGMKVAGRAGWDVCLRRRCMLWRANRGEAAVALETGGPGGGPGALGADVHAVVGEASSWGPGRTSAKASQEGVRLVGVQRQHSEGSDRHIRRFEAVRRRSRGCHSEVAVAMAPLQDPHRLGQRRALCCLSSATSAARQCGLAPPSHAIVQKVWLGRCLGRRYDVDTAALGRHRAQSPICGVGHGRY